MRFSKLPIFAIAIIGLLFMQSCATQPSIKPDRDDYKIDLSSVDLGKIDSTQLELAYKELQEGRIQSARRAFYIYLAAFPDDADGLVGAGFAALRDESPAAAADHFSRAVAISPGYADAHYGLALALSRRGETAKAAESAKKAYELSPEGEGIYTLFARLNPDWFPALPEFSRSQIPLGNFRISAANTYQVKERGVWKDFFWKGINLGAALPGKYASEFPDKSTYEVWFTEMGKAGFNLIRVYTVHPPRFYEALREYNLSAKAPLYLVHGVWAELPPGDDFRDATWWREWQKEMMNVIDLLHGRANIPARPGHASGAYRADLSPWVAGIILGREWEPGNVEIFNKKYQNSGSRFSGRFVECAGGTPMEVFLAEAMEFYLAYEHDGYNTQSPIAFTNWPTTDPLYHPSEATKAEEAVLRKKLNLPYEEGQKIVEYDNDAISLDMEKFSSGPENRAGMFASYHAYPYYPDFMNLDPDYKAGRDAEGPNNYIAYLSALVAHHAGHPVVISEFGVPSSRLVAHWQAQGMNHGGLDETAQGAMDARMLGSIRGSGCQGAVLFAWIDEWFKKNWLVIDFENPLDRKPFWYNVQDAEENYGLLGYHPGSEGPTVLVDGKDADWAAQPVYAAGRGYTLKVIADEGWLHLGLWRDSTVPLEESVLIGVDTHDLRRGDHRLPFGLSAASEAGLEFVVIFQGEKAAVFADNRYDLFTHRYKRPYRSQNNSDGTFLMPQTESNRLRVGRDGTIYPEHRQEIGWLRKGSQDRSSDSFNSLSEWTGDREFLEARIPWGLLNMSDPSSRTVVSDRAGTISGEVGGLKTDGFRFVLATYAGDAFASKASLTGTVPAQVKGRIAVPPLFTWKEWEVPTWHMFKKESLAIYSRALQTLSETAGQFR